MRRGFQPGSQNTRLLDLLRKGPVPNYVIARKLHILSHTRRISDLREHGYDVIGTRVPDRRGVVVYQLVGGGQ